MKKVCPFRCWSDVNDGCIEDECTLWVKKVDYWLEDVGENKEKVMHYPGYCGLISPGSWYDSHGSEVKEKIIPKRDICNASLSSEQGG